MKRNQVCGPVALVIGALLFQACEDGRFLNTADDVTHRSSAPGVSTIG